MWSEDNSKKDDPFAGFDMTPQSLKKLCKDLKLYSSCPELNEILHLHQKGIVKMKNLDEYVNLRTIYFECNAISKIEGLDHLVNLRCLYLNENLVEFITGLDSLTQLETLDLADNQIKTVQGLSNCSQLRQLNLSGNRIQSAADVYHLTECQSLLSLDLSKNRIDEEMALEVVRTLNLRLLRMVGNPVVSTTRHYRKTTIVRMPELHYMDDSPVFPKDRRLAEAWCEGGAEAESEMRAIIRQEEADTRERHRKEFDEMIHKARADAAAAAAAAAQQQAEKERGEEAALLSAVERDASDEMVTTGECDILFKENGMDEDKDVPRQEKFPLEARKRDASALDPQESPTPRKHWRGVEFIGSNVDIQGVSPMDENMDLESTDRYIDDHPYRACQEASSIILDDTMTEFRNGGKVKVYSGLATLMGDSEELLELPPLENPITADSDFELTALEDCDPNSEMTCEWEAYGPPVADEEETSSTSASESERRFQWTEKERRFKRELHERILRRAVVNADAILERGKKQASSGGMDISLDEEGQQSARPIIWGTEAYRNLWAKAAEAADEKIFEQNNHDITKGTDVIMDSLYSTNMSDTEADVYEPPQSFPNATFENPCYCSD
ncbi:dynein axonemal assembly factor 1 [Marchantia polymorpha subsp. ruderalis]|uniref:Dynein assembly factor 1, axonemal homolog n=2 Tax=Marchantia polymorpha TaxID=3197 RepID=A0AAF6B7P2_MARPO|nr:hypothetical protein MARPO_0120s0022 [Marchantia polymorpha]BBN08026.1 hypothetical protein Mp_4g08240 [Marchantia polymorpha subsp. ruderalis]|eukprot:PTQ30746.1 hypothetical protein MARPO_0120s0022 [Marchantia polymorpha]